MIRDIKETLQNFNPTENAYRGFSFALFLVVIFLAWRFPDITISFVLLGLLCGTGVLFPKIMRLPVLGLIVITLPIGWIISRLILDLLFFSIITPLAYTRRLFGYDPLGLQFRKNQKQSYWEDIKQNTRHDRMY